MKLRGIEFGNPFVGAGTLNFFGEGWPFHRLLKILFPNSFNFTGATFVAKTMAMEERMPKRGEEGQGKGNLVLDPATLQPVSWFPDCIYVRFLAGEVLNAVGLTGPGAKALYERETWQKMLESFMLSLAIVGKDKMERDREIRGFTEISLSYLPDFKVPVALQYNISCPNAGCATDTAKEAIGYLKILRNLGIPQGVKVNNLVSVRELKNIEDSGYCDFFVIPNTLLFGQRPDQINWEKKFGKISPLAKYGGGGYSGKENFELATEKVEEARAAGIILSIILEGVIDKDDIWRAWNVGADAVGFARAAIVRPWRIQELIKETHRIFLED